VVVCSGYSTVMDAAVAGTPCVIHPATDEQDAVAARITAAGVGGFTVAEEPLDVVEAATSPPEPPSFGNGAAAVAEAVLDDLEPESSVTESPAEEPAQSGVRRRPTVMADRAFAATVAVGAGARSGARYAKQSVASTARRVVRGTKSLLARVRDTITAGLGWAAGRIRAAGSTGRRYAVATAAVTAATVAFTSGVAGRTKRGTGRRLAAVGGRLRSVGGAVRRAGKAVRSAGSRTLSALAGSVPRLG